MLAGHEALRRLPCLEGHVWGQLVMCDDDRTPCMWQESAGVLRPSWDGSPSAPQRSSPGLANQPGLGFGVEAAACLCSLDLDHFPVL